MADFSCPPACEDVEQSKIFKYVPKADSSIPMATEVTKLCANQACRKVGKRL